MFESQQSQMHLIWLSGTADPQTRRQVSGTEDRPETPPVLGRMFAALRRFSVRHRQACAATCRTSSLPRSTQACC